MLTLNRAKMYTCVARENLFSEELGCIRNKPKNDNFQPRLHMSHILLLV